MSIHTNPPAFPIKAPMGYDCMGMTLRDYFAAKALQGMLAYPDDAGKPEQYAKWSYEFADAMLKERSNP